MTARDGIQAVPWYHMPTKENRASWAKAMIKAGIPHIEIGFPVIDGDPETIAVRHVVEETRKLAGGIRDAGYMAQFSAEDATRTEDGFLRRVYAEAVSA